MFSKNPADVFLSFPFNVAANTANSRSTRSKTETFRKIFCKATLVDSFLVKLKTLPRKDFLASMLKCLIFMPAEAWLGDWSG